MEGNLTFIVGRKAVSYCTTVETLNTSVSYIQEQDYGEKRLHGMLILTRCTPKSEKLPTERGEAFVSPVK
jgi:hypothetical protein